MRFKIIDRMIQQNSTKLGTQGENDIEEIEFTIPKIVGKADLSQEGTQCVLYCFSLNKQEISKILDFSELDENTMIAKWSVGREETQIIGTLYVALHFSTAFDNVLKTEITMFEISRTINIESPQPVLFNSRRASPMMVQPEPEIINIIENRFVIPPSLQNIAVQNDNEVRIVPIKMSRTYMGEDLSAYSIRLHIETQGGSEWLPLTPQIDGNEITMLWTVQRPHTSYAGKISIQLEVGTESTDTFFKQTEIASLTVLPSLGNEPIIPVSPPEFEAYLRQIEAIRAEAETAKSQSVAAKDISVAKANEAADSATLAAGEVTKAKAEVSNAQAEVTKAAGEVDKAKFEVTNAKQEVINAQNEVAKAAVQAVLAGDKADDASGYAIAAEQSAVRSDSEADRAKAEADRAASFTADYGLFSTQSELNAAYPIGKKGALARVSATETYWYWNETQSAWLDSGTAFTGGTTDYNQLINKAKINGVEVVGDKTLSEYGIQPKGNYAPQDSLTAETAERVQGDTDTLVKAKTYTDEKASPLMPHIEDMDRHTSLDEKARIEAELSKKVDFIKTTAYPNSEIDDFNYLPNGYSRVNEYLNAMKNAPKFIGGIFNGQVFTNNDGFGLITQTATMENYIFTRSGTPDHLGWLPWTNCAIAKAPQRRKLPLFEGLTKVNAAEYWKNEFEMVTVSFCVTRANGGVFAPSSVEICTLPIGFRPVDYVVHGAGFQNPSWGHLPIVIENTGRMIVTVTIDETYVLMGTISFYVD